ncbi:MAG: hypothetical protein CMH46_05915 [Muricauda sp.]|nr:MULTISPECIES: MerC domain-containing protein [unclassified Allomuricauda]MAU15060.1 hypothetical protein [Allomuricauda sp.]|tara:strand:- start:20982 stop:21386 length:405 start_codon:yes stop_codon:yes gene_type:complete
MGLTITKPDIIGALVSSLCVVHCIATPFIFVAHTSVLDHHDIAPVWWTGMDFLFLMVSFFAVIRSVKNTSKSYMRFALWASWFLLLLLIMNEKLHWAHISETFIYLNGFALAALHIYNLRYCQCKNDKCCTKNG